LLQTDKVIIKHVVAYFYLERSVLRGVNVMLVIVLLEILNIKL